MSQHSPRKSLRAAATRRRAPIIDDSDDEENQAPHIKQEDEEEFTPKPAPAKRGRGRPKKVVDEAATPKVSTRRRLRATESLEPTQVFTPASEDPEPLSPTKKPVRKRAGARPSRRERLSAASSSVVSPSVDSPSVDGPSVDEASVDEASVDGSSRLPTPQATQSPEPAVKPEPEPEPTNVPGTPLADITNSALNDRTPVPESRTLRVKSKTPESDSEMSQHAAVERVNVHHTVMERPMDIVVRKRAAGIPMTQEHQTPKQRTVITWLVLTNFKSYAGEQRVGPFHASFSSVVGPNGSGKSNVIDSLLFVFGFRASKMRQGKISALIHNSAAFPNLEYCEVEVHFQEVKDLPTGGSEVVPDSQLVISRRAFKNNSSKYYINNKESTFTVVTNLLKDRGVDLDHKRFLILQGEVESIAQMKPKAANEHDDGLLEYLEDIIGTSKYKTPIEEWAAKTEELNEICMEKNSRVQHVEKERSGMEEMKNKALEFIRDENELATKQSALYQIYISDLNDHIQVAEESVGQMQARLDEELQKHQGSEEAYKQLERQHKKATQDHERLEKQAQELQKDVAKVKKETISLEEKKKYLANKLKKHEKTKETSQYGISEATTLARQYADDMERYDMEIAELEESKKVEEAELEKIRANLSGKTQSLSDEIAAKQKSLEPWNAKINEKQSAMAVAQSELDILREKENAGAKGIAELEARIVGFEESKETKAAELQECTAAKKGAEKELGKLRAQLEQLSQKEPALKTKLSGARQKADEARASLSATQTQGNVLTGLMRLKESGRIDGFHGRLGNLGAINQKYDVAISTACPQLNNLVVDSVEVGQQCIDYLRKNNLGRANFILLDRLPKRDLSQIPTPENVPRLFDLVKPKHDRFLPAFFSVLQNTLVASDLQQANRIAYGAQRWRVVTLDGQLIDKSGTMSGGGTRVAKGGMSSKLASDVSKDQVAKLEQDRDDLEKTFGKLQQEQRDLEATIRELTKKIPELENKAELIELELRSFDGQISDANRRIKELSAEQSSTKSDKSRISTLEKSIGSTEKEISKLRAETAGVEAEIKALQDKIMEIGGVKLRGQKAKVDGLKQQIDTVTEARLSAEGSKSKEEKNRVKHEKAHATAVKELEKVAKDAAKVEADMEAHKHNAAGIGEQAEEALEAVETSKEHLAALKKELEEKQSELNQTKSEEMEIRNNLKEAQKGLDEFQKKQRHYQGELGKLSYHNVSDLGEEQEGEGLPTYTKDELEDMDKRVLKDEIEELEKKLENVSVDLNVLEEYRKRVEEHAARSLDLAKEVANRDAAKNQCDELRRLRLEGFMEGFSIITARLKEMYQMITMGGNAELELVDSLDPFSEGILFSVMPPKKSWKNISNLSGGEKTLSSLALVFALHHYKPTPLYVMDEIDAALDFRNVSIVASYIQQRTKNAQFIVISLRNNMFELAARLVGVYKVNHMTKSVTIQNKNYLTAQT